MTRRRLLVGGTGIMDGIVAASATLPLIESMRPSAAADAAPMRQAPPERTNLARVL